MRQGQGNRNNRNRNRNRNQRSGGGGGNSGGGGHPSNKVFDSNGPDVKLRGTAQTVAEKYMQLGRDAQSSGDSVSAESYYQHAEHYYRVWASNQPVGASLIMSRKLGEEEFEEDGEGGDEEQVEGQAPQVESGTVAEGVEGGEATPVEGQESQPRQFNNNRNDRNNNGNRNDRNNNNRERFRPRWQDRNRNQNDANGEPGQPQQQADTPAPQPEAAVDNGQWEAPSFLQRPTPAPVSVVEASAEVPEPVRRPRQRRERVEQVAESEAPPPVE